MQIKFVKIESKFIIKERKNKTLVKKFHEN